MEKTIIQNHQLRGKKYDIETLEYNTIKKSICKIESFTEFVHFENEEIIINNFLDRIIEFTNDLNRLTNLLTDLDKELDIKFNAFDHETKADLVVYLSNLRGKAIELHLALLNTPFSEGMKTAISEHQFAVEGL